MTWDNTASMRRQFIFNGLGDANVQQQGMSKF